ncbi:MAG TPA: nucleoside-diphosphate sugar epimerase/dehydratase [Acidimicrobiales bacterium]|nr:nucleoside-diphosphate sugar epimerase/dehydratase [Acidimicrobiales bacterium]
MSGDAVAWVAGLTLALVARYDFAPPRNQLADFLSFLSAALVVHVIVALLCGLYQGRWRMGSFDEVAALARAAAVTTAVLFAGNLAFGGRLAPMSVPVAGGAMALVGTAGARYAWRLLLERHRRPSGDASTRLLVFGAGEGAVQVLRAMLSDPESRYLPVALLDDDPDKRNLRIMHVPVMGTRSDLAKVAERVGAEALLVAVPSAGAELVRDLTDAGERAGLEVKVLPSVSELLGGHVGLSDIRTPTIADLLGRREIDTDIASIAGYLTGRRVMVTGAGGSIGAEVCRQVYRLAPSELIMLDRDESGLHAVQLSLTGRALLDNPNLVVADIRDADRVSDVFERWRPQVVFHAAALKHLPLLEAHPCEAVKTNVWGTQNLLTAAVTTGVERFVNISTDKAADPSSVLGYTKRIAERLTAHTAQRGEGTYLSVRFGNVLGSRGSVLGTFLTQIEAGGPVTVTHPDITRYFMTVEEAVQLVIQAGAIGRGGEVLVLDMGQSVRIADVVQQLIAQCERRVEIVYTGLRPGEKLHEVLRGDGEADNRPVHPLISHVEVPALEPQAIGRSELPCGRDELILALSLLCQVHATTSS